MSTRREACYVARWRSYTSFLGAIATTLVQHVIGYTAGIVDYDRWLELGLRLGREDEVGTR
jgi:hypothetical protein